MLGKPGTGLYTTWRAWRHILWLSLLLLIKRRDLFYLTHLAAGEQLKFVHFALSLVDGFNEITFELPDSLTIFAEGDRVALHKAAGPILILFFSEKRELIWR